MPAEGNVISTFYVTNIHCPSCVSYATDVLSTFTTSVDDIDTSVIDHVIRVQHVAGISDQLADELKRAAFEVQHVTVRDMKGKIISEYDMQSSRTNLRGGLFSSLFMSKAQKQHVQNCNSCQALRRRSGWITSYWQKIPNRRRRWRTSSAHTDLESGGSGRVRSSSGIENTATYCEKAAVDDENGEVQTVLLAVEGMTCGSCSGAITRGLQELDFVHNVDVDLMNNCAKVEYISSYHIDAVLDKISDLGYDASIIKFEHNQTKQRADQSIERSVQFELSGMYCPKCPSNVVDAVQKVFGSAVSIVKIPSLKHPQMTITYRPSPPSMTIRDIYKVINSVDPNCSGTIFQDPSLEQRSQTIRRKEHNRILRHLFATLFVAIPSFIIGVVYMTLVPSNNSTRQWFEQPIWAGNATRMDWALFIMTTPAMFYGASLFHTRAIREIWSLWRPSSSVPLLRRFYRFGSMNLLISAGTSVAYFASLAILVMNATSTPQTHTMGRKSTTYFDTVTFLTLFILVGRYLEAYSKAKTSDAVSMLANLRPKTALLVQSTSNESTTIKQISTDLLEVGDIVTVPHGACPPADGTVAQEGSFVFDESSLTGESQPAQKRKGDKVFTGTVNSGNPVQIVVDEVNGRSLLDQIIDVVRGGQARRAPIERLADSLTGYFTPIITLLAIITWIVWLALGESGSLPQGWLDVEEGGWPYWSVEFAIAVFVVACPCGIGLAAPTALFVGSGLAASSGILVQGGGEAFQEASRLDAVVFDKTGTLTEGRMKVIETLFMENATKIAERALLNIAKALEEASTHPVARAIASYCESELRGSNIGATTLLEAKEIPGQGMLGKFAIENDSEAVFYEFVIGNERLLSSKLAGQSRTEEAEVTSAKSPLLDRSIYLSSVLSRLQTAGNSTAILAMRPLHSEERNPISNYAPALVFAVSDPLRAEAHQIVNSLRLQGLQIHLCTGDNKQTAQSIASQLSIPIANVRAEVLPGAKATYVQELQSSGLSRKIVAFVGDGTNDTPALTVADVSIALSHPNGGGSDIALTSSSFVLLNSDLHSISKLIRLSKRVFLRVKLNFAWAAVYNMCLLPVAAGVFFPVGATWGDHAHGGFRLNPVWASVAMAGSSVSVVLSSLALKLPEFEYSRLSSGRTARPST